MRSLLTFPCEGAVLGGTLDAGSDRTGLLICVGGTQTRIGSHRMFERLARAVSGQGHPVFRFDRRGVGDSSGDDPGWRGCGPDLAAAAAAFRREAPHVERIVGLGLCDGAGALCFHAAAAGLSGLVLVNPWLVEAGPGDPPPAALRRHYRHRLTDPGAWKKLLNGSVSYKSMLRSIIKSAGGGVPGDLSTSLATALRASRLPAHWLLAEGDATAVAAAHELTRPAWDGLSDHRHTLPTDSHTFAKPGDMAALETAVLNALEALQSGRDQQ